MCTMYCLGASITLNCTERKQDGKHPLTVSKCMKPTYVVIIAVCVTVIVLILVVSVFIGVIIWRKRKSRNKLARLRGVTINIGDTTQKHEPCQEVKVKRLTQALNVNGAGEPSELLKIDETNNGPKIRGVQDPVAIHINPPPPPPPVPPVA
ncbi:uncharacterized protein LOC112569699 [Pomacea canaliculata]|uniref:uncharacterized protein LOC112569699 n=1 Tax=Pomacea canaliculata TaxID=400727 RepID=UPI000D73E803|nr:uncharacterized protein LOC112569699 [Pomacea canaliculata]